MKHTYQKPVITLDAGMAEGVYAASGSGNTNTNSISYSTPTINAWWAGSGQADFPITLSSANLSNISIVFTFNMVVKSAWVDGASFSLSGTSVTLNWNGNAIPTSFTLHVQTDSEINNLKIVSATLA